MDVLKNRLPKEGGELITFCNQLKMLASDGKMRLTDCLDTKGGLRLVQSIPSPKAEPFKIEFFEYVGGSYDNGYFKTGTARNF